MKRKPHQMVLEKDLFSGEIYLYFTCVLSQLFENLTRFYTFTKKIVLKINPNI